MLVLSRKARERVRIGDDIVINVLRIGPNTVRLGITAPGLQIVREEINVAGSSVLDGPVCADWIGGDSRPVAVGE